MAKERIKQVTITYDLDYVLEYHYTTIDGKIDRAGNHLKNEKSVREWYMEHYPQDDMGCEIKSKLKWDELFEKLRCGVFTCAAIGVEDSLIRDRIDGHLCRMLNIPHMVLDAIKFRD